MAPSPFSGYLLERYRNLFSEEEIRGFTAPLLPTLRINTLRTTPKALIPRLKRRGVRLERIPWTESGYIVKESPVPLGATPEYLLGHYFLQDAVSIYASEVLDPKEYETVLDMVAAPGGKTTHIAQRMGNRGTVVALEINRERMRSLRSNTNRMGVENVLGIRMDALRVGELGLLFDRILLDAPCTGTGTLSKNPEAGKKELADVERCTGLQKRLLEEASSVLKSRGRLLYSTCSLLPEENELIVQGALEDLPLKLEKIRHGEPAFTEGYGETLRPEMHRARRFYPHLHGTQGFFLALMKKR